MNYYCTLFDSAYFSRGLLLHRSLMNVSTNSFLYIFAFDDVAYNELVKMNLLNTRIISLENFEDEQLLEIKSTRSKGEYCWTCTPSIIKYCLEQFKLDQCTYLDADLYFFSDPSILLSEMKDKSVLITEHRYTLKYDQTKNSGKYCVQFMSFKNTQEGLRVLNWWRERCIEWCYARLEDGKFGDQKYLDDWMARFTGVCELSHIGGGVAPWNLQQYKFKTTNEKVSLIEKVSGAEYPVVFFHFHALKIYKSYFDLGFYEISSEAKKNIYFPYLKDLLDIDEKLTNQNLNFNWHAINISNTGMHSRILKLKRILLGTYNIVQSSRQLGN